MHASNLEKFSKGHGKHNAHEHILPVKAAVQLFKEENEVTKDFMKEILYN